MFMAPCFLLEATFRANPAYALTELSRLNQSEQTALTGFLTGDPHIFGVFNPIAPHTTLTPKIAYKDVALLFYFFQEPSSLPQFVKQDYDDELNDMLAKLVLEEVLQLAHNGTFISGVEASKILYKERATHNGSGLSGIAALSQKAIQYVLRLNNLDYSGALFRLYSYNTVPAIVATDPFDTNEAVEAFLGIRSGSALAKAVAQHWHKQAPAEKGGWLAFHRKGSDQRKRKNAVNYKMYISPLLSDLPNVFEKTMRLLAFTKAFSFKTGTSQRGLLRPDKFVVYFYEHADLQEAAVLLKEALTGFAAQGVPFTAQLDDTGLLSWGIDPPRDEVIDGLEGGSWRASITEKLAAAVLQAKAAQSTETEAYNYVLNKIFLERIDPVTWMPQQKTILTAASDSQLITSNAQLIS